MTASAVPGASAVPAGASVPGEDEVRALVARVVAGVAGGLADGLPGDGLPGGGLQGGGLQGGGRPEAGLPDGGPPGDGDRGPAPLCDVAVGADHGGYPLKERIAGELRGHGFTVQDCGTTGTEPVDYPDFALAVATAVAQGRCRWGIVVDGAGIGSCIAANKVAGIRAATCWDVSSARNSREHNHANVLALGAGLLGEVLALQIVQAWLSTPWGGDRHARRVEKIADIERRYLAGARP